PAWMKASDIMTRELVTVTAERTLDECLLLMEQNGIFHLIVLNEVGEFRGMLSVKDILRVVASDEKARADLFEAFIFPPRYSIRAGCRTRAGTARIPWSG